MNDVGGSEQAEFAVSPAGLEDAEELAALAASTFRDAFGAENEPEDMAEYVAEAFSPEATATELADPESTFLLARLLDGRAVGYAKLRAGEPDPTVSGPRPIELQRLYLDRPARGRGIGSDLMRRCLVEAGREGYGTMWLGVWERNEGAISFYRRWRFRQVGDHDFRLGRDIQRDLIMQRSVVLGR